MEFGGKAVLCRLSMTYDGKIELGGPKYPTKYGMAIFNKLKAQKVKAEYENGLLFVPLQFRVKKKERNRPYICVQ